MSTRPHVQEARERFKKISEGHFVWFVVFLQCSEIESDCFEVFQYLPPARMKVTQLMSTRPHVQEARERFKKIGEGHVVRCVVFLQCSEIESDCFQIFNLSEIRKYRPSISYHAAPAGRRNKMLEWRLATLNASSPTMAHALEKTKDARIGVICLSASSKLSASCLHDSIDVYTATRARSSRKVQEDKWRSLCVVCGLLAMLRNRK